MAADTNKLWWACKTYGGTVCKIAMLVGAAVTDPSGQVVAALKAALDALTKAKLVKASVAVEAPYSTTKGTSDYCNVEDKMVLEFADVEKKTHLFKIPGPTTACFLTDETDSVDTENADVIALVNYIKAHALNANGGAIDTFLRGYRQRTKKQRQ